MRWAWVVLAVWAWLAAGARAQTTVELVRSAVVRAGEAIKVRDVARVTGPLAETLAGVEVSPDAGVEHRDAAGWTSISAERVREAIAKVKGVNLGQVAVMGAACSVTVQRPSTRNIPAASPAPAAIAGDVIDPGTIRGRAAAALAVELGVEPAALRITWANEDADLLDQPVGDRAVEVSVLGTADRLPMRITAYRGDSVDVRRSVMVDVRVRRRVHTLTRDVRRGERVPSDAVRTEEAWVSPRERPAREESLAKNLARANLVAGRRVLEGDLEAPIAVRRGDIVTVHCVSGTVIVQRQARAQEDALDGQLVELAPLDSTERKPKTFPARMSGAGRAVIWLSDPPGAGRPSATEGSTR